MHIASNFSFSVFLIPEIREQVFLVTAARSPLHTFSTLVQHLTNQHFLHFKIICDPESCTFHGMRVCRLRLINSILMKGKQRKN